MTRPGSLRPPARARRSWPGPRWPARREDASVALAVRASPPARGARAPHPPSPSRLAGGGAVPGRRRPSLELGGAWQPGPAEVRGAGRRRLGRRRRRGGHDRGAERAAAERGAEGERARASFRRAARPRPPPCPLTPLPRYRSASLPRAPPPPPTAPARGLSGRRARCRLLGCSWRVAVHFLLVDCFPVTRCGVFIESDPRIPTLLCVAS